MHLRIAVLLMLLGACGDGKDPEKPGDMSPAEAATEASEESGAEKIDSARAEEIRRTQEQAAKSTAKTAPFTETYRHPSGVYFMYPSGWRVQPQSAELLALVPPDVYQHQGQPAEVFLVVGTDAPGVTSADDPRIAQQANLLISQLLPFMQPAPKENGALAWSGRSPTGLDAQARMYFDLQGGYAVGVLVVCPASQLERRRTVARDIARTFGFEKPESDPRLVGRWRWEDVYMSGSFSMVTVRNLVLKADGTCLEGGKMAGGMQHSDAAGNYGGDSSASSGGGIDRRGKWYTEGARIILNWSDGTNEAWNFFIRGNSMLFREGGKKRVWKRVG